MTIRSRLWDYINYINKSWWLFENLNNNLNYSSLFAPSNIGHYLFTIFAFIISLPSLGLLRLFSKIYVIQSVSRNIQVYYKWVWWWNLPEIKHLQWFWRMIIFCRREWVHQLTNYKVSKNIYKRIGFSTCIDVSHSSSLECNSKFHHDWYIIFLYLLWCMYVMQIKSYYSSYK